MLVFTGDQTGLVKVYSVDQSKLVSRYGTQDKDNGINQLLFLDEHQVSF